MRQSLRRPTRMQAALPLQLVTASVSSSRSPKSDSIRTRAPLHGSFLTRKWSMLRKITTRESLPNQLLHRRRNRIYRSRCTRAMSVCLRRRSPLTSPWLLRHLQRRIRCPMWLARALSRRQLQHQEEEHKLQMHQV